MGTVRTVQDVQDLRRQIESRTGRSYLTVVLLGKSGNGLDERRQIARLLEERGMNAVIPEDDLPHEASPSLAEEAMLLRGDADLVFLDVESWGTATEFGQFHDRDPVARKLRILVPRSYHPLEGDRGGYLSDLYLTHVAVFGHVYPVSEEATLRAGSMQRTVLRLAIRYGEVRALKPRLTK